ncbi:hypothetical protein HHK36_033095 [Tetracentron sinense]|uniref:non-specific serine/threonine protein kinase n=1 Tax=Tetracentron sinense TaxID=13715 RepID=A0A835CWZ7_TETSI|nr:hypothetical protein HHK36_033095 [Tetracentron sinense]
MDSASQLPSPDSNSSSGSKIAIIVGLGTLLVIVVPYVLYLFCYQKKDGKKFTPPRQNESGEFEFEVLSRCMWNFIGICLRAPGREHSPTTLGFSTRAYTYEQLAIATNNFSIDNRIGEGGFACVYKGFLDGKVVAVKKLETGSIQGKRQRQQQGQREFESEVETISKARHKHVVSLIGYCNTEDHRMLVLEFVPKGTLKQHLHAEPTTMEWDKRQKIALGSARGLEYLHEGMCPGIIHRDIKATNILLDDKFEAKVADFGLAKFLPDDKTHISTNGKGTPGYIDPEYWSNCKLTAKSDVYSFGVVLLELITGRPHVQHDENLVHWVSFYLHHHCIFYQVLNMQMNVGIMATPLLKKAFVDNNFDALIDPKLQKDYNLEEVKRMAECANACVNKLANRRPQMSQIVWVLQGKVGLVDLKVALKGEVSLVDLNKALKGEVSLVDPNEASGSGMGQAPCSSSDYETTHLKGIWMKTIQE